MEDVGRPTPAVTDDQRSFRIPSLQPRSYYLRAGGLIVSPMNQVALKEGPGGSLQYQDTYYPGTARLDEAQPGEITPYVETNGLRFSVATEKAYTVTESLLSPAKRTLPRPREMVVLKRNVAEQTSEFSGAIFPDGTFKISGLPPGDYTLSAMATTSGGEISEGYASVHIVDSDVHANLQLGRAAEVRDEWKALPAFYGRATDNSANERKYLSSIRYRLQRTLRHSQSSARRLHSFNVGAERNGGVDVY